MTRKTKINRTALLLALLAAVPGCDDGTTSFDETTESGGVRKVQQKIGDDSREEAINDLIYGTLDMVAEPESKEILGAGEGFETKGTGTYKCTYTDVNEVDNFDEIIAYNPNAGILYPGAIIQGNSVEGGILEPVQLARTGGEIFVDLSTPGTTPTRPITKYSAGSVATAVQDIFQNATQTYTSAAMDFRRTDVRELEQTMMEFKVDAEWAKTKLGLHVKSSKSHLKTDMFVFFRQRFYTVAVQDWAGPNKAKLFQPSVTPDEVAMSLSPRNPPTYIRNVTYGRMLLMRLTTEKTESELKAALDAAFAAGGGSFNSSLSAEHRKVLESTELQVQALGGDPQLAAEVMTSTPVTVAENLRKYLYNGSQVSLANPGQPLSYVVSHLATDDVVKMASATQYQIPDCQLTQDKLRVTLDKIKIFRDGDGTGKGDFKHSFTINRMPEDGDKSALKKYSDGESIPVNQSIVVNQSRSAGSCFDVHFRMEEYNDSGSQKHDSWQSMRKYCYRTGTDIYEAESGPDNRYQWDPDLRLWRGQGSKIDIEFQFKIARFDDCGANLRSDGTVCTVPSAYSVNKSPEANVEVCEGTPVVADLANVYATSSHVRNDADRYFIGVQESDPWWNGTGREYQAWTFMGREPGYVVAQQLNVGGFLASHSVPLQSGKYYRMKIASHPWNETTKNIHIKPTQSSFVLNEEDRDIHVGIDEPVVLAGDDSCTVDSTYTLTISGAGDVISDELTKAEAKEIGRLDLRKWVAERNETLKPGNQYTVELMVSNGHTMTGTVTIDPCPTYTKWNGAECMTPLDTNVWAGFGDECLATEPGGVVDIVDCSTAPDQEFEILPIGEGMVRLESRKTGECLSTTDFRNAPAIMRPCDYGTNVQFDVVQLGPGVAQLRHPKSNQCLSFATNGIPLMTNCANTGPSQIQFDWWRGLVAATPPMPLAAAKLHHADSDLCVGMKNEAGTPVGLSDCATDESALSLERVDADSFHIKDVKTGLCVTSSGENGSVVEQVDCDAQVGVDFRLVPQNDKYRLEHEASGTCLYNDTNNGSVNVWDCWDDPNMEYDVEPVATNLALGAKVSAQSTFSGYDVNKIIDGNPSTVQSGTQSWANAHVTRPNGVLPQNVDIDFGVTTKFSRVDVFTSAGYAIADYDLQALVDGEWVTLVQVRGNTELHRIHAFSPVAANQLRVVARRGPAHQPIYARINEVEVY